ncbi:hypothetical protein G6F56_006595 [Rhizopus delemar]|uniref:Uncharacterized protein n=1 Tax=Rhizopus stolonifer TaxID=4846 RepID=A0A367JLH4_RHIST|nr:hypothetical protein G6F56_006595 [Rhizopus delemar]RCH90541.1 hypothetical protein CU098_006679 [Rhizopus stolonifer]
MTTLSSAESFPKRLRSASARLFSMNTTPQPINKRSSCYFNTDNVLTSSPNTSYSVFNPSTWFPRIRQRSTSSSSSTFSLVYTPTTPEHFTPNHYISCSSSIESISIELEELFNNAKIEIDFAFESQGSIYYEGDYSTAHSAFSMCLSKYESALQNFGDTANTIKFTFRWETDIHQLRLRLNALPEVTNSIYN